MPPPRTSVGRKKDESRSRLVQLIGCKVAACVAERIALAVSTILVSHCAGSFEHGLDPMSQAAQQYQEPERFIVTRSIQMLGLVHGRECLD